ncbi:MAG: hypothetical protein ACRDOB_15285 [Streptosporangiaceae bacterium]
MADRRPRRFLAGGLIRQLRRLDVLFGTAWRAAPLLATECILAALGSSLCMLAYPIGFRAIVDGAFDHRPGLLVTGLVLTAIAFPGYWVLQLVGAALNSRMTDLGNLSLGLRIGKLTCDAPFLEHFERPDYLTEIDALRERRRNLAGAPAQTLGMLRSGIVFVGAAVLLARHVKLGDEVDSRALRAAHAAALWEASGWVL